MVRFGVIGLGLIGRVHVELLGAGAVPGAAITAASDLAKPLWDLPSTVRYFETADALIDSDLVDAVIVAAPHRAHVALGPKVIARGLHLLMEKPLGATKAECERLIATPRRKGQLFGVMTKWRTHPLMMQLRSVIRSGSLGTLQRTQWTNTHWFRPEAYYKLGGWRGTWAGEGGGVLINQAQHTLDLWQWLCGMPQAVWCHAEFGRDHRIEVEDHVTAICEFADGMTGTFTAATGEYPGVNRLEIAGTRGLALFEDNRLQLTRTRRDAREFSRSATEPFALPGAVESELLGSAGEPSHAAIIQNFTSAILDGTPLLTPVEEGINAVELANAMLFSAKTQRRVTLPLSADAYQRLIDALGETAAGSPD